MKTLGIIAEYNPFHLGHRLHIEKSKKASGADIVIVVMSGNFVQRGEPAIIDKWTRTKMALLNGADMVIELPILYATASAEYFAHSAVKLLHDTGLVDILSFGSECGQLTALEDIAQLLNSNSTDFTKTLKDHLCKGASYAKARSAAIKDALPAYHEILSSPNNILGIEYLKALDALKSQILPMTIAREGAGYHDTSLSAAIASASAIRKGIYSNGLASILPQIPKNTHDFFCAPFYEGFAPICLDDYSSALNYALRSVSAEKLSGILDITEGLENRLKRCGDYCLTATQLAEGIKTKRYTLTKIQRILVHLLLNINTADLHFFNQNGYSPYIRVLGFRREHQKLLKALSDKAALPTLVNLKYATRLLDEKGLRMLDMETRATDIYFCFAPSQSCRMANQDYTRPLVIMP